MHRRNAFTLIELMVVVLIVGILGATVIPIIRGRTDAAKWSEGKSMMGSIATAIRAYRAEKDASGKKPTYIEVGERGLGFAAGDLTGRYFADDDFSFKVKTMDPLRYTITCKAGHGSDPPSKPKEYKLSEAGLFTPKH